MTRMVKKLGRSPNDCERDGFVEEGVEFSAELPGLARSFGVQGSSSLARSS